MVGGKGGGGFEGGGEGESCWRADDDIRNVDGLGGGGVGEIRVGLKPRGSGEEENALVDPVHDAATGGHGGDGGVDIRFRGDVAAHKGVAGIEDAAIEQINIPCF